MGLKIFISNIRRKYKEKKEKGTIFSFDVGYVCFVVLQETGYFSHLGGGLDNE